MKHNLIGQRATITKSNNKELIGITGTITNETKHTITMNNKTIIKDQVIININDQEHIIPNKTPADRIKVRT
jgi:RNase P/RNase MRP subunit p29